MDQTALGTVVQQICKLKEIEALPEHDFSVAELEGKIAGHFNTDVTCRQVVSALGFLGVQRKSPREWDHDSLEDSVRRRLMGEE